jgi:alpha-galactosidase
VTTLTSLDYTLTLVPEQGTFSVIPHDERLPAIENIRLEIIARQSGQLRRLLTRDWKVVEAQSFTDHASPHGDLHGVKLYLRPVEGGLRIVLTFALFPEKPLVLWKAALHNLGGAPVFLERVELLRAAAGGWLDSPQPAFYCNGWQSWAYSGSYGADQAIRRTRMGFLQGPLVTNTGTPQHHRPGEYSSDFFGILGDRQERRGLLVGMLSERQHFASIEALLKRPSLCLWANGDRARLDAGEEVETDWAALYAFHLDQPDPLEPYLDAVARENMVHIAEETQAPAGWCSWYHFYQNLSATQVEDNLAALLQARDRLPLSLVQIDDGYERQVGDWLSFSRGFPRGVSGLAEKISRSGLIPGLWLAPFIVHPGAQLMRSHPDWILRGAFNLPVNAGFVWDRFTTALDLTHPEALDYACQVVKTAAQERSASEEGWGFQYLKLDFLYAGALPGRHRDPTRTRAQILRAGLEALRQAVGPQVFLLGCGVPLGPSIGIVNAMRISADVSGSWRPQHWHIEAFIQHEPHMPSVRNAIQNILARANLHHRWWMNDPDCLLLRPETHLSLAEVRSLASVIGLTGGSVMVSDDLSRLPAEVLLPAMPGRAKVLDWFDTTTPQRLRLDVQGHLGEWSLLGYFNWSEHEQTVQLNLSDYRLPEGEYWARSFWEGQTWRWSAGQPLILKNIPSHGAVVLAVRLAAEPDQAQYLGSDVHFSQGVEVCDWQDLAQQVRIGFSLPRRTDGEVELQLPNPPQQATINGEVSPWRALGERRYAFNVAFDRQGELIINF